MLGAAVANDLAYIGGADIAAADVAEIFVLTVEGADDVVCHNRSPVLQRINSQRVANPTASTAYLGDRARAIPNQGKIYPSAKKQGKQELDSNGRECEAKLVLQVCKGEEPLKQRQSLQNSTLMQSKNTNIFKQLNESQKNSNR
jgi:hypothetical protein